MLKIIHCLAVILVVNAVQAQIIPPYSQDFDSITITGWSHYATQGTDDWERGVPNNNTLNAVLSAPSVWATNLDGDFSSNSVMCLETPAFDLSDTTEYVLNFAHQYQTYSYHGGNVEYSTDNGTTWTILDGLPAEKKYWYTSTSINGLNSQPGWANNYYNAFKYSKHSLDFLSGQSNVRFRFQFGSPNTSNLTEGWVIDNFSITENSFNVVATQGQTVTTSEYNPNIDITTTIVYNGLITVLFPNVTNYYFSYDAVFDAGDSLIGTKSGSINSTTSWTQTVPLIPGLNAGTYYVFYEHDVDDSLAESSETDNVGYALVNIDSTYEFPVAFDFEQGESDWVSTSIPSWDFAPGYTHQMSGAHSGENAWNIYDGTGAQLESPYFDFSSLDSLYLSFRYISLSSSGSWVKYSIDDKATWQTLVSSISYSGQNEWGYYTASLAAIDTVKYVKLQFSSPNMVLDDIHIGKPRADLCIEGDLRNNFTIAGVAVDTLDYYLYNTGAKSVLNSVTEFYWSTDSILDGGDVLLGSKNEIPLNAYNKQWTTFTYTKPTAVEGTFYIIAVLDANQVYEETWESNNTVVFHLHQQIPIALPYYNDFETQANFWRHNSDVGVDEWEWASPSGSVINQAFSGAKGWVTQDAGLTASMTRMHLYTPVFDFSSSTNPVLEFDMYNTAYGGSQSYAGATGANLSYSVDGGLTWTVVDSTNLSFKGVYFPMEYQDMAGTDRLYYIAGYTQLMYTGNSERSFTTHMHYQSRDIDNSTHNVIDLAYLNGAPSIQFRYNFANKYASIDGMLIDNFTIREAEIDLNVSYKKSLMMSSMSNEIEFQMDIVNQGNYLADTSVVEFYLSIDTVLDGSDPLLGQQVIPQLRPNFSRYIQGEYPSPVNLSNYKYLIYSLDVGNTNAESDEVNNIGYWSLGMDTIVSYPYLNEFEDDVIDGWRPYHDSAGYRHGFRFRHKKVTGESTYQPQSGEWYLDRINTVQSTSAIPHFYLESPLFNFAGLDEITITFNFICVGRSSGSDSNGGNMQYSIDGGNTWGVLTITQDPYAVNWYNITSVANLDGEPGWAHYGNYSSFTPAVFDASFLKGEEAVKFRYKFRSKRQPSSPGIMGFRLDSFRIGTASIDYLVDSTLQIVNADIAQPGFPITYTIKNTGNAVGKPTNTNFYWSDDNVWDGSDVLLYSYVESSINPGDSLTQTKNIYYPTPITQAIYYLFYESDAMDTLVETNESNNSGKFMVVFDTTTTTQTIEYGIDNTLQTVNALIAQPTFNVDYTITNSGNTQGSITSTNFYWSVDNVYDVSDTLLSSVPQGPIASGSSFTGATGLIYPTPVIQFTYYVFCIVDAADDLAETNETNNVGQYEIIFDDTTQTIGIGDNVGEVLGEFNVYSEGNTIVIDFLNTAGIDDLEIELMTVQGQVLLKQTVDCNIGYNHIEIRAGAEADGIYLLRVNADREVKVQKVVIH